MKHAWILLLIISLASPSLADKKDPFKLGNLSLGQKAPRVLRVLGQPAEKSEVKEEAATGEMVQRWSYPKQGLELDLSSSEDGQPLTVYRIYAKEPCNLSGYRGISIGTFAVEVQALARRMEGRKGLEVSQGELGYGFLWLDSYQMLSITVENGKVSEIFLGPGPE